MSDNQSTPNSSKPRKRNRITIGVVTVTALVVAGAFGVHAFADSRAYEHVRLMAGGKGDFGGFHQVGWRRGHHQPLHEMTEAEIEARVERMVKHVSIEIDATPAQEEKIAALVTAIATDLKPIHGELRAAGEEIRDLLLADSVDRIALEKVRADTVAEADRISKDLINAAADVAEVLTPTQRKLLGERIDEFRAMGKGWRRG